MGLSSGVGKYQRFQNTCENLLKFAHLTFYCEEKNCFMPYFLVAFDRCPYSEQLTFIQLSSWLRAHQWQIGGAGIWTHDFSDQKSSILNTELPPLVNGVTHWCDTPRCDSFFITHEAHSYLLLLRSHDCESKSQKCIIISIKS